MLGLSIKTESAHVDLYINTYRHRHSLLSSYITQFGDLLRTCCSDNCLFGQRVRNAAGIYISKVKHSKGEPSSTMRALQRPLVSVLITYLNDMEHSLNIKWLRPVAENQTPPLMGNQSETPSYLQFKLFHFIYPQKETYTVIPIIESENIPRIVPHENPLLFW